MSKQPISTHKNARYINDKCNVSARNMFNAMLQLAESDKEYEKLLIKWLEKKKAVHTYVMCCVIGSNIYFTVSKKKELLICHGTTHSLT